MPRLQKKGKGAPFEAPEPPPNNVTLFEISPRVAMQAAAGHLQRDPGAPHVRPLRIYTLDPSLSGRLGGVTIANVPYEKLAPGPIGSLFEIDASGAPEPLVASSLDLDTPFLLMSRGLTPSPSDGQFHLQMVYAVCSLVYAAFRRALGRDVAWSMDNPPPSGPVRLKVRPFGFRGRNAGFSRETGDLSFGYFRAGKEPAGFTVPKGMVFTCLSHDVIAHETTHALLDGLRASFSVPTNPDVPAFHEGFADLVALFMHFSYPEVVEQAIRESRGNIGNASLLSDLAREFGYARSTPERPSVLRSAIDVEGIAPFDSDALFAPGKRPRQYSPDLEMHALGSVLVSAVFEAFVTIVRRKCERFFRIAGIASDQVGRADISDDLVRVIAQEASEIAGQFLNVCIRAIDYCPPVDVEFGDYLRAMVTADAELLNDDSKWGYREALMRSFRRRGIFPSNAGFMTEQALKWKSPNRTLEIPDLAFSKLRFEGDPGRPAGEKELLRQAAALGRFVSSPENARLLHLIAPGSRLPKNVTYVGPITVQSIRCARKVTPDGRVAFDLIAEVSQTCTVRRGNESFEQEGGTTLVIDPYGGICYSIYKRPDSEKRQESQHRAMRGPVKRFWAKERGKYRVKSNVLQLLDEH